jgi:hypothetical protein
MFLPAETQILQKIKAFNLRLTVFFTYLSSQMFLRNVSVHDIFSQNWIVSDFVTNSHCIPVQSQNSKLQIKPS